MTGDDLPSHLSPEAGRVLSRSVPARFTFMDLDKIIETPPFRRVQARLEELYAHPRVGRPPNLLIYGPSGIGKSHAIDAFVDRHRPRRNHHTGQMRISVVHMEYPPEASRRWFAAELAKALGYAVTLPRLASDAYALLLRLLDTADTRVIVCEEIGNIPDWRHRDAVDFYGMTRWLSNQSKIPLVYSGIETALGLIDGDLQVRRRFERISLELWAADAEFAGFIKAYCRFLPLQHEVQVDRALVERLHLASAGVTDTAVKVLVRAAKRAILNGSERVTADDIGRDADLPPPPLTGRPIVRRRRRGRR